MQVYDNRRAVDYLLTRKEVNGNIGITGASGGGNQSMNAGAIDDRLAAVVPVCSVGDYQAYLQAACCVCEVLPNALTFSEEGDVLGLVAPRALMVINASRDAIQFSPPEAEKSVARAMAIYQLFGAPEKLRHVVFESGHDYSKPMREAMYGWMTLHLKAEGKGDPIPEPEHRIEKPEDLACYSDPNDRPKGFLTPPLFAGKVGRELVARVDKWVPDHPQMWEATANHVHALLRDLLGPITAAEKPTVRLSDPHVDGRMPITLTIDAGIELRGSVVNLGLRGAKARCLVIHSDGEEAARAHSVVKELAGKSWSVLTASLRLTGSALPKSGAIAGAPDHTPAEHGIWIGRPLLGQWAADTLTWLGELLNHEPEKTSDVMVAVGHYAPVALVSAALSAEHPQTVILIDPLVTYVTDVPYASGTPMGILAPGILKVGDIPHLAGLVAPRRLVIAGGVSPQGKKLTQKELEEAFCFTTAVYKATKASDWLTITADPDWKKIEL
jgi:hypothetical protein